MKNNLIKYLFILVISILFVACKNDKQKMLFNGYTLPDVRLPNVQGDSIAISDLKNKIVLVEFWASWCKPCREKHPELNRIRSQYLTTEFKDGEKGFEIYYVDLDESKAMWQKAMKKDGIDQWKYHVADLIGMKKSAVPFIFDFDKIPTAYLIDGKGTIIGVNLSEERLEYELTLRMIEATK